jgi:hypothetical protein
MTRSPCALLAAGCLCFSILGAVPLSAGAQVVVKDPPAKASRYATKSQAEQNAKDDEMICVRDAPTGSHIKKNVCATRAEWKKREEIARQQARSMQGGCGRQGGEAGSHELGTSGKADCFGGGGAMGRGQGGPVRR